MLPGKHDDGVEQGDDEDCDDQSLIPVVTRIADWFSLMFHNKVDDADGDDVEANDDQRANG